VEVYKFKRRTVIVKMTPEQKREFDVWCSQRGLKTKIAFRRPKRVYVEMDKKRSSMSSCCGAGSGGVESGR